MPVPQKDKFYVLLQFVVFLAWLFGPGILEFQLSQNLQILALSIAIIGFILIVIALLQMKTSITPFPSPKKDTKLITTGAFAFARHPIYTGVLFMAFGISVWLGSGYKLLMNLLLYLVFFLKSRYEEKQLLKIFPQYALYKRNTGRFFPKFKGRI